MKEHKKMYKAGKLWLTATLATVTGAMLLTSPAFADEINSTQSMPQATTSTSSTTTVAGNAALASAGTVSNQGQTNLGGGQNRRLVNLVSRDSQVLLSLSKTPQLN
ncbi:MAG: KxYKxGKxW signal peptide domain-containing protein [Limosilactobacillus oris]